MLCESSPSQTDAFAGALAKDTLQPLALLVPLIFLFPPPPPSPPPPAPAPSPPPAPAPVLPDWLLPCQVTAHPPQPRRGFGVTMTTGFTRTSIYGKVKNAAKQIF